MSLTTSFSLGVSWRFLALPLINIGVPLGVLYLTSAREDAFTRHHQEFLTQIQSQLVLWIQHHHLIAKLSDSEARYRALIENIQRFNNVLGKYVERYPEQWFWVHRRWKT